MYIPLGVTHCLENPGKIPLDLIEVRSGTIWKRTTWCVSPITVRV
ncbi:hypothetical protein ACLK2H_11725 [Escherichia coli]